MKDISKEISKLKDMKEDLYYIISNISAMNEEHKSYQNNDRVYLWTGVFYRVDEYGVDKDDYLRLYILAKTEEEAETRLKARADEEYDVYEFYIDKVEEDEYGIIKEEDMGY